MSAPTWIEYLAQLEKYLESMSKSIQLGSDLPTAPEAPCSELPLDCKDEVDRFAVAFAQLALEVKERLAGIDQRLPVALRSPHQNVPASYVDLSG